MTARSRPAGEETRLGVRTLALLALAAAAVLAGGIALPLALDAPQEATLLGTFPRDRGCAVPFRVDVVPDGLAFVAERADDGPHPIDRTTFEIRNATGALAHRRSLADAADSSGADGARYADVVGDAATLDAGDRLVVATRAAVALTLFDADGATIGGSFACR